MNYTAQGDLNLFRVDSIPAGLPERQPCDDGRHVLAHSETGHHHVLDGNAARVYDAGEYEAYLDVREPAQVIHLRSFDTHDPVDLEPGVYRITRQREYTPEGFRRAQD